MLLAAIVANLVLELVRWVSFLILAVLGVVPWDGLGTLFSGAAHHLVKLAHHVVAEGGAGFLSYTLDLALVATVVCVIARRGWRKVR